MIRPRALARFLLLIVAVVILFIGVRAALDGRWLVALVGLAIGIIAIDALRADWRERR